MKSIFYSLGFFTLVVLFYGCPYSTPVALDSSPKYSIDKSLLGTWRLATYPADSSEVKFVKKSDTNYDMSVTINEGDSTPVYEHHSIDAFISKVGNETVLNAWDFSENAYYLIVVRMDGGKLSIIPLSDAVTDSVFATSDELRVFMEQYLKMHEQWEWEDSDSELLDLVKQ